jgi:endonuclease YncB( thermonuclease family)
VTKAGRIAFLLSAVVVAIAGHHWRTRAQAPSPSLTGQALVVDGDSIELGDVRVRIFGIDAPELSQPCKDAKGETYRCGSLAASVLEEEIGGRAVTCFPNDTDHYGRVVATCQVAGRDLGDVMVRRGLAVAYERYSSRYIEAEAEARRARRGIWAGNFDLPEDWRHRK